MYIRIYNNICTYKASCTTYVCTYIRTYIHSTYVHTYIRTYIHTYTIAYYEHVIVRGRPQEVKVLELCA